MSSSTYVECSLCVSQKKRSELYSHTCNNLICCECIFTNILLHLRIECPYCRLDYTNKELGDLFEKQTVLFDKINGQSTEKMMAACECGYDMINACMKQSEMIQKMGEAGRGIADHTGTITSTLMNLPFKFVLAMQKDAKNILIVHEDATSLLCHVLQKFPFFHVLGVDRVISYVERNINELVIPVYSEKEIATMGDPDHYDRDDMLEMLPVGYFLNNFISKDDRLLDKLINQDAFDIRITIRDENYAEHLVDSLQKIITLPESSIISASEADIADLKAGWDYAIRIRASRVAVRKMESGFFTKGAIIHQDDLARAIIQTCGKTEATFISNENVPSGKRGKRRSRRCRHRRKVKSDKQDAILALFE